jgi:transposase
MPWRAPDVRKARNQFVMLADREDRCFAELCRSFSISRGTGYLWLKRYRQLGDLQDLGEMNRRPHHSPNKIRSDTENKVVQLRDRSGWGATKISASLKNEKILIAPSTAHSILRRHGRVGMEGRYSSAWIIPLLLAQNPLQILEREFPNSAELSCLANLIKTGRPRERKKAIAVIASLKCIPPGIIADCLQLNRRAIGRYLDLYHKGGITKLFSRRKPKETNEEGDKHLLFALLHTPPSGYGINRTTWKMDDLHKILIDTGHRMSQERIRRLIRSAGFRWRKAKVVLTSKDPDYLPKVEAIANILSALKMDEAFLSIDEFGPFAIRQRGGLKRVSPGENYVVPQWQKSKGWTIITAALELSRNRVTHFYSQKKNTEEMIKMADLLRTEYRNCSTVYLSWDAASWHVSKRLFSHLAKLNQYAAIDGLPILKTAPLPAGFQFLNVIESVFSGMARAIIHNSDYPSFEIAKVAIDRYFDERNKHFAAYPKRAGHKIWGRERVPSEFSKGNNCKDPRY